MRLFLNLGKAVGTLIAAMVVIFIVGANAVFSGISVFGGDSSISALTSQDVHGSARLSKSERDKAVGRCSRMGHFTTIGTQRSNTKRGLIIESACDCVVNQLEDRSSKMQFLMAMRVIEQAPVVLMTRSVPDFSDFYTIARKHGMSQDDFSYQTRQIQTIARSSIKTCSENSSRR